MGSGTRSASEMVTAAASGELSQRRVMRRNSSILVLAFMFFSAMAPRAFAVPSYARQTGLPCSGCHYTPPELNAAGRLFKLMAYTDKADDAKVVKADGSKKRAALDLLASLPLSVMLDA